MSYELKVKPTAIRNLHKAFIWHESATGVNERLRKDVNECYRKLAENPYRYRSRNKRFRRVNLKEFPYYFLYSIKGKVVSIFTFKHASQR